MPSDRDAPDAPRPLSADLGWILLFVAVTAFAVAGMIGVVRL
ncbi:hypothetical protein [Caldovatus aquaticus]|nr:hypothetical protein [Caldovatus aquaticus]